MSNETSAADWQLSTYKLQINQMRKRHFWSTCKYTYILCVRTCTRVCVRFSPLGSFKRWSLEEVLWCFVKVSWAQMKERILLIIWRLTDVHNHPENIQHIFNFPSNPVCFSEVNLIWNVPNIPPKQDLWALLSF